MTYNDVSLMVNALKLHRDNKLSLSQIVTRLGLSNKMAAMRLIRRAEAFERKMQEWASVKGEDKDGKDE